MKYLLHVFLIVLILTMTMCRPADKIDLAGEWKIQLDRENKGESENWYKLHFDRKIVLPGSLRDSDIGEIPSLETVWTGSIYDSSWFFNPAYEKYRKKDSLKFPFWLTPERRFVGSVWYQKEINIPNNWKDKVMVIYLERPHWQTKVWIDTTYLGRLNSLSTPHVYTIRPGIVKPGKHQITILVDNAIRDVDPGINSHSITDHTQGNWNGIIGKMLLKTKNLEYISGVRINPCISEKNVSFEISFHNLPENEQFSLSIDIKGINHKHQTETKELIFISNSNVLKSTVSMGSDFKFWNEFEPNLYEVSLKLENENGLLDTYKETFGMREFSIKDKHFEINGIPVFLRGTTECCVFPLTGYPPTDEKEWSEIFSVCKSYGLNHMRFHSYCPPEAAFSAADKAGIYLQVEGPSWAKYSVTLGDGKPIDQYLMDETTRIIDTYGNHPSFCLMAYGNEPSGHYTGYLENWVDHFRQYDSRRVYTGASTGRSWKIIENSDFIVRSPPRGLEWSTIQPESEFDYRNKTEDQNRPYITFEMGQWCVFPNFKEITKYTGPLKARNFGLFKEELEKNSMGNQAEDFLMASGKLQASCYKQEIEATLRTPNLAGFQLLSLNDFPGQGTALVGILDAFWDSKGYITSDEFRSFCNSVVPLARFPKFTFSDSDTLNVEFEVANFSGKTITNAQPKWKITGKDNFIIKSGDFNTQDIPIGHCNQIGNLNIPLNFAQIPAKYTLEIMVDKYSNHWNFWVYPNSGPTANTKDIYICRSFNDSARKTLMQGGKVLLLAAGQVENGKDIIQYYTPVFWNTSWFRMRPPHTTGVLIQNNHLVFKNFPTDFYSDLQWWGLVNKCQIMNLENFPPGFKPIVQPIDTWFLNRRLATLFEARVNGGNLMVCSMNLMPENESKIVSGQLYNSIINYMNSSDFNPEIQIESTIIEELFEPKERNAWNSYVKTNP